MAVNWAYWTVDQMGNYWAGRKILTRVGFQDA